MKRYLLLLALALLCTAGITTATQKTFMFGVWQGVPKDATMGQHLAMLHDTLRMNTVFDDCQTDYQFEQYSNPAHPLKVIAWNHDYVGNGGMNGYLRLYTLAPYAFFESEGTEFADSHLKYIGGQDENIDGVNCRYFPALPIPYDSLMLIQTGPGLEGHKFYNQLGWYWPHFVNTQVEDPHLQYQAFLRFKLGPRTGPASSEPIAVFYMGRWGGADGVLFPDVDTLIEQRPLYLYDSQFDSAGTDFIWSDTLKYQWNNSFVDSLMTISDVMFNVRWSGARDIYIDKVKIMDNYGYHLWEDTVTSFAKIDSFVTKFSDYSSTILGWYLQDDQDVRTNCNNVYSARRVDSLVTNRFSKKPGFVVPAGWVDEYISVASYSSVSFQSYQINAWTNTSSDGPYDSSSLQYAWDTHTSFFANMSELAESKGVKPYATLQAFAAWDARRPTPEENLCQVNLALAYGMKGILYWRYGAYNGWEDSTGRTPFWYGVKNTVGPYIDKMGPIFAELNWKDAWQWGDTPPFDRNISYISCDQYGNEWWQDPLYLQVAQFKPASNRNDTAYFFLVNRRCLPEESISGTLGFWGFAEYERVNTVYYVTDVLANTTWQCDTHNPPDPPHTFTYSISPGAGRLYRVTPRLCQHGDANSDGGIDISDVVFLIARIFSGGAAPNPPAAGDANCDHSVDISDVVFLIAHIFAGGSAPCPGCD